MKYDTSRFRPTDEQRREMREEIRALARLESEREYNSSQWLCYFDIYKKMVEKGFKIMEHVSQEQRNKIIYHVMENKDIEFLKMLLQNGLVTHEKLGNYQGYWCLLEEAMSVMDNSEEFIPIVEHLINHGCPLSCITDPEVKEEVGYRHFKPLAFAAEHKLWKIVELFLEHGADGHGDLEFHTNCGESLDVDIIPLLNRHNLRFHIESTVDFWEGLLGKHIDPDLNTIENNEKIEKHFRKNQLPMLKALIENGMTFDSTYPDEEKSEFYKMYRLFNLGVVLLDECPAQDEDHLCEVLQFLIDHGYDVTTKDGDNKTALHMAARGHRDNLIKLIIDNGGDLNIVDDYEMTPFLALGAFIHMGPHSGLHDLDRLKRFIDLGGDYNVKLKDSDVPHLLATLLRYSDTLGKQLCHLLDECNIEIPLILSNLYFEVFQPAVLYKLAQVGVGTVMPPSLLPYLIMRHALESQTLEGYELIKHVSPLYTVRHLSLLPHVQDKLDDDNIVSRKIKEELNQPRSLLTTAIFRIRVAVLDCMRQENRIVSLLPRLRVLAKELPWDLRARFTLDCYMTEDWEMPGLSEHRLKKLYKKNLKLCNWDGVHAYGYLEDKYHSCPCDLPMHDQDEVDTENE